MSIPKKDRIPAHPAVGDGHLAKEPPRVILMTPLMATVGALLVFFTVAVVVVVIIPNITSTPQPSEWMCVLS